MLPLIIFSRVCQSPSPRSVGLSSAASCEGAGSLFNVKHPQIGQGFGPDRETQGHISPRFSGVQVSRSPSLQPGGFLKRLKLAQTSKANGDKPWPGYFHEQGNCLDVLGFRVARFDLQPCPSTGPLRNALSLLQLLFRTEAFKKKTDSGCRIWNGMVVSHRENLSLLPNTHTHAHTHTGPPRRSVNYSQHHTLREVVDPEPGCRLGISWLPAYQQQD